MSSCTLVDVRARGKHQRCEERRNAGPYLAPCHVTSWRGVPSARVKHRTVAKRGAKKKHESALVFLSFFRLLQHVLLSLAEDVARSTVTTYHGTHTHTHSARLRILLLSHTNPRRTSPTCSTWIAAWNRDGAHRPRTKRRLKHRFCSSTQPAANPAATNPTPTLRRDPNRW